MEQSQIARLTEEMSMQKHQTRQLETMYLNALRENDDLRNECGILTRKQVNEVLAENARLKEEIDANRYCIRLLFAIFHAIIQAMVLMASYFVARKPCSQKEVCVCVSRVTRSSSLSSRQSKLLLSL